MNKKELQDMLWEITKNIGLLDFYLSENKLLKKTKTHFFVSDLDETLFSRKKQLKNEEGLRKNRGEAWNTYMVNNIGIYEMIEKYYVKKKYPQEIITTLHDQESLILTAGMPEYQEMKKRALGFDDIPMRVVVSSEDKILELIRYVLFRLKYLPKTITIYEDRPEYFIKYRPLIEKVLSCQLKIMKVEMDGNNGYKKIEEVS